MDKSVWAWMGLGGVVGADSAYVWGGGGGGRGGGRGRGWEGWWEWMRKYGVSRQGTAWEQKGHTQLMGKRNGDWNAERAGRTRQCECKSAHKNPLSVRRELDVVQENLGQVVQRGTVHRHCVTASHLNCAGNHNLGLRWERSGWVWRVTCTVTRKQEQHVDANGAGGGGGAPWCQRCA